MPREKKGGLERGDVDADAAGEMLYSLRLTPPQPFPSPGHIGKMLSLGKYSMYVVGSKEYLHRLHIDVLVCKV